jgi:SAM-dependent methyltransferase
MESSRSDTAVLRYFDRNSRIWENLYQERGSSLMRWANRTFRKDIWTRFEWAMKTLEDHAPCSVLDLGCGTGVYSVELARKGNFVITAVDVSPMMVLAARRNIEAAAVSGITLIEGDGLHHDHIPPHDVVLAIGLFDYLRDAPFALSAIRARCREQLLATFPKRRTWRAPVRKLRLALKGCPVYFYSAGRIREMAQAAGWHTVNITELDCIYCVQLCCGAHTPGAEQGAAR